MVCMRSSRTVTTRSARRLLAIHTAAGMPTTTVMATATKVTMSRSIESDQ